MLLLVNAATWDLTSRHLHPLQSRLLAQASESGVASFAIQVTTRGPDPPQAPASFSVVASVASAGDSQLLGQPSLTLPLSFCPDGFYYDTQNDGCVQVPPQFYSLPSAAYGQDLVSCADIIGLICDGGSKVSVQPGYWAFPLDDNWNVVPASVSAKNDRDDDDTRLHIGRLQVVPDADGRVHPYLCPFDYCTTEEPQLLTNSTVEYCSEESHRDPESVLCGACRVSVTSRQLDPSAPRL